MLLTIIVEPIRALILRNRYVVAQDNLKFIGRDGVLEIMSQQAIDYLLSFIREFTPSVMLGFATASQPTLAHQRLNQVATGFVIRFVEGDPITAEHSPVQATRRYNHLCV